MNTTEVTRVEQPQVDKAYLIMQRGDARLEVFELPETGRATIGRALANNVVVPDAKCSRQHCELFLRSGRWVVRDLDSRNGVLVDGARIEGDRLLEWGESIQIGACTLLFTDRPQVDPAEEEFASLESDSAGFQIIERKSGTQYDGPDGVQRIQRHRDGATDLFSMARSMVATRTEEELCRVVLEGLRLRTGVSVGGILLAPGDTENPAQESLEVRALVGQRPATEFSSFLTRIAWNDKDAVLAHDISQHAALASQDSLAELQAESAVVAPIRHEGASLGVIHLYSLPMDDPIKQADLEFVLAVADQMGDQLHSLRSRQRLETGLDQVRRRANVLQEQLAAECELVGNGPRLEEVRRAIQRVAPTDALVLIRGESGVGKELVARALHLKSHRKDGPFVTVNCAALSESLLESELFGHEKGAFTGAANRRAGKFEQAHGGTLFLDEIGEMSPEIQAKFLRVLEGQAFERVGGGDPVSVDVRVVTATNRDLEKAVRERQLRRDLFFRLQVIEINVSPLREHPEDIPAIATHFLRRFAEQSHRRIRGFDAGAMQKLKFHAWPGNVRELRNVVERAVILTEGDLLTEQDISLTKLRLDSDAEIEMPRTPTEQNEGVETWVDGLQDLWGSHIQKGTSLDEIDRLYIEAVLRSTDWNKSKASRILQIERTTLDRRLKKYGIGRPGGEIDDGSDDDL